jgi:hypothetical protein
LLSAGYMRSTLSSVFLPFDARDMAVEESSCVNAGGGRGAARGNAWWCNPPPVSVATVSTGTGTATIVAETIPHSCVFVAAAAVAAERFDTAPYAGK